MSTEHQLCVHFFSVFFTFALIYQEIEGMNDSEIDVFIVCFIHTWSQNFDLVLKNCKLQERFDFTKEEALFTSSYFLINPVSLWSKHDE